MEKHVHRGASLLDIKVKLLAVIGCKGFFNIKFFLVEKELYIHCCGLRQTKYRKLSYR